ncbi:hypothetical protein EI42_01029 [Thermosporothrix hazakensis]|jgi:hypothetical protein|uniref:Uncharacterized protein n=1 Tax=Thermosporothrix hazakensis TaxID=644383 RepID=A0A326UX29_THEHA|nr:hypothetical protein [Thermosporothrix hazakensis]PZW36843.1 hypothetical protein EI42_01029 [Thermosporothrix hazakensis]GCE47491.1 hypothetical protein KTH_23600 [Thermosporothrix hazakensis]
MDYLYPFIGQELEIRSAGMFKRESQLWADQNTRIATLRWKSSISSQTTIQIGEHTWTFSRKGFFKPEIQIEGANVLTLQRHSSTRYTLILPDGQYAWTKDGVLKGSFSWHDQSGAPLVQVSGKKIRLEPAAASCPSLSFLTAFGWFLHRLYQEEMMNSAALGSAASS